MKQGPAVDLSFKFYTLGSKYDQHAVFSGSKYNQIWIFHQKMEIDFMIEMDEAILPIEVKSSNNRNLSLSMLFASSDIHAC